MKKTPIETNHEIKTNIFTEVKISYEQFLAFLSFMNTYLEAAIKELLKILQYSKLKRDSNTGVFL